MVNYACDFSQSELGKYFECDDISKEKRIYNASRMSMAKKKKAKNKYCKVTQLT